MAWVSCLNFNTGTINTVNNNKKAIKRQGARTEPCYNIPLIVSVWADCVVCFDDAFELRWERSFINVVVTDRL